MTERTDYETTYDEFWRDLVETDGSLDLDKVKRELHDYARVLDNVPKVYCHITHGRISKANTPADAVISEADAALERHLQDHDEPKVRVICRRVDHATAAHVSGAPADIEFVTFEVVADELSFWLRDAKSTEERRVIGAEVVR